jgi:Zn-dependent M28 family amino/carboxypeptidase
MMPGANKEESVVLSAHIDHLGRGGAINGDDLYNGAMDNASGVATLIETAHVLKAQKSQLKRNVVFVAVTGEEKGLQGSRFYSRHPTVRNIVANFNFDMYLPLHPLRYVMALGMEESNLRGPLEDVCRRRNLIVQPDNEPQRNRFIRSDQYSFIQQGVPALALKFGYEPGSPEEKIQKQWISTRYHAPSDDLAQPVDRQAASEFNAMVAELAAAIANLPEPPAWNASSFFRRFAHSGASSGGAR